MNDKGYINELDRRELDRLVDGALSREEYKALLEALDARPQRWRHCALAFLEQQALARELGALREEVDAPPPAARLRVARSDRWSSLRGLALAMAASFLVAFFLGTAVSRNWLGPRQNGIPADQLAGGPEEANPDDPLGSLTFVVGDAGGDRRVSVPLFDAEQFDSAADWWTTSAVPQETLDALERSGHQVLREKRWLPVDLRDGRSAIVPFEDVEIVPIGLPVQ